MNVEVKLVYLSQTDGTCAKFVDMVDEVGQRKDFCSLGELQCKDGGQQLHFEYIPNGQSMVFISISGWYRNTVSIHLMKRTFSGGEITIAAPL